MSAMSTNINRFTQAFCKVNHQNLYQNSLFSGAIAHGQRKFARNQAPLAMVHAVLSPVPALPCIDLCSVESFSILLISVFKARTAPDSFRNSVWMSRSSALRLADHFSFDFLQPLRALRACGANNSQRVQDIQARQVRRSSRLDKCHLLDSQTPNCGNSSHVSGQHSKIFNALPRLEADSET